MAGGPYAQTVPCDRCRDDGVLAPAERVTEGSETDWYTCARGHSFGIYWRQLPDAPMWPEPSHQRVSRAAYLRWLARGGGDGAALDDWLAAERALRGE